MSKRIIEETFHAIRPKGRRSAAPAPVSAIGISSANGNVGASLSAAGQQIAQLQNAYQQQAALVAANTEALAGNTASRGASIVSTVGKAVSGGLGGGLGLLSPIISGIAHLFGGGGGSNTVAALPVYVPPAPVYVNAGLSSGYVPGAPPLSSTLAGSATVNPASTGTAQSVSAPVTPSPVTPSPVHTTQITVHVNAMDSQSFMDRSSDIASAVREAMLNTHPINDVIAGL